MNTRASNVAGERSGYRRANSTVSSDADTDTIFCTCPPYHGSVSGRAKSCSTSVNSSDCWNAQTTPGICPHNSHITSPNASISRTEYGRSSPCVHVWNARPSRRSSVHERRGSTVRASAS